MYFRSSQDFKQRYSALFDFMYPAATAMWNLRWQVQGYLAVAPNATKDDLMGRFVKGSQIGSVNLRASCLHTPWEEHLETLASLFAVNAIALFEGWIESLELVSGTHRRWLQFPSAHFVPQFTGSGVGEALIRLRASGLSPGMMTAFGNLSRSKHYDAARLDELLVAFRVFKEARNCWTHNGGAATPAFQNAEAAAATQPLLFGTHGRRLHLPTADGSGVVHMSLSAAQGLAAVVLRIVTSIDAELAAVVDAEKDLVDRWRQRHGKTPLQVSADEKRRNTLIVLACAQAGLPRPHQPSALYPLLRSRSLVWP